MLFRCVLQASKSLRTVAYLLCESSRPQEKSFEKAFFLTQSIPTAKTDEEVRSAQILAFIGLRNEKEKKTKRREKKRT